MEAQLRSSNVLLSRLPEREYERLAPMLEPVSARRGDAIYQPGGPIDFVEFPLTAVALIAVPMADGAVPTVAIVGHEGLVGLPALLGERRSLHGLSWCVSGSVVRIRSEDLLAAAVPFSQLVRVLGVYAEIRLGIVEQNAACSGLHEVRARCSRTLLTLSDAADADRLDFSHKSLALMLGVTRQSASLALESLRIDRKISYAAGHILILDRDGLEGTSCECYAILRSESERSFGLWRRSPSDCAARAGVAAPDQMALLPDGEDRG